MPFYNMVFLMRMIWAFLIILQFINPIQCARFSSVEVLVAASQCKQVHDVIFDSVTGVAYASCSDGATAVISIDHEAGSPNPKVTVIASSSQCPGARSISVNSATGVVYAACTDVDVGVISIDTRTNGAVTTVVAASRCSNPRSISVDRVTGLIYAACVDSITSVISISIGSVGIDITTIATTSQCASPFRVAAYYPTPLAGNGGFSGALYVACGGVGPKIISVNTGGVGVKIMTVPTASLCRNPYDLAVNSATGAVYVTCFDSGVGSGLIRITPDIADNFDVSVYGRNTYSKCQDPLSVSVNSITGTVYVTCTDTNTLDTVIRIDADDTDAMTVNTDSKCQDPLAISLDDLMGTVYVACSGNDAAVISILQPNCAPGHEFNEITSTCDMCNVGTCNNGGIKCRPSLPNTYAPLPGCSIPLACSIETHGKGISCSNGFAYAKEGYWLYTSNSITREVKILPCLGDSCIGSTIYGNRCGPFHLQNSSNIMCYKCVEDYTALGGKCYPCKDSDPKSICLVLLFSFIFIGVMHYLSQSEDSINLSIFFYFIQTGLTICGNSTETLISWFNVLNFKPQEAINSCLLPLDPYQTIKIDIVVLFLYFIELLFVMIIHFCFDCCFRCVMLFKSQKYSSLHSISRFASLFDFEKERYIRTFNTLCLASFSTLLILVLRYMYCIDIEIESKPTSVLYFNPAIDCNNPEYNPWSIFAIFVLYLIPASIVAIYLYCKVDDKSSSKVFTYGYDLSHKPFSLKTFYLQAFILGRRLLVGIIATILASRPADMYLFFTLLHGILCVVHSYVKPYGKDTSNNMEIVSLLLLTLLSCFLMTYTPSSFSRGVTGVMLALYVIPSVLLMLGVMRSCFLRSYSYFCEERDHNKRSRNRSF